MTLDHQASTPLAGDFNVAFYAMPKQRDPRQFTKKETIQRLQEAKGYLGNKERLAFFRTNNVLLPSGYKPDEDESYYAAPKLSEFDIECLINSTKSFVDYNWRNDKRFSAGSAVNFVGSSFGMGAVIGESVAIMFYSWKKDATTKVASLWLGTWHHAPIIVWGSRLDNVRIDFLPSYIDLIH